VGECSPNVLVLLFAYGVLVCFWCPCVLLPLVLLEFLQT